MIPHLEIGARTFPSGLAETRDWIASAWRALESISAHRRLTCLALAAAAVAIRLAALHWVPIPDPAIHDEFSYLLGAETFAAGRLTNPTPAMWVHFETIHENFRPTYMTKYPPGQSLLLALGQKFFGHPWYGVVIGFGLMCGCLCWMLQGWMPPVYAFIGSLIAITKIGLFGYWMDSYWGGALAAAAGALVWGAVPRLARRKPARSALPTAAIGMIVLMNTRPYEGVIACAAAALGVVWLRHRRRRKWNELISLVPIGAAALVVLLGIAWTALFNQRVTGSAFIAPYVVNSQTYAAALPFLFLPAKQPPAYRHESLRRFWVEFDQGTYRRARANPLSRLLVFKEVLPFYCSTLLFFAGATAAIFVRSLKLRFALAMLGILWIALLLETFSSPHYLAPVAGMMFLPALYALRWTRVSSPRAGTLLVLLFTVVSCGHAFFEGARRPPVVDNRHSQIERELILKGGQHLVIVEYAPSHDVHAEYVYNHADIDPSPVIWARDMGESKNRELIDYYPNRTVWRLRPDSPPFRLDAYSNR